MNLATHLRSMTGPSTSSSTQITGKDTAAMTISAENTPSNSGRQGRRTIRRLWAVGALAVGLFVPLVGGVHVTHAAGNSDAAHACQQGGYLSLQGSDGTTFANEGQCVSYVAHGGTIVGVNACTVTSTTGCLTFNNATLPEASGPHPGATISLTGSTSFEDACSTPNANGLCGPFTYPNANALATGGGTYVERDSTGAVLSQGIYRIADTAGSSEGLFALQYLDSNQNVVSSCPAATGVRAVEVVATLIDSSTGTTQTDGIIGETGTLPTSPPPPFGEVLPPTPSGDAFVATLSSSTISLTC
jgi:hypothetical protein